MEPNVNSQISDDAPVVNSARELAKTCLTDMRHTEHVTRLALQLFDQLKELHQMGEVERNWLEIAAVLHDAGWVEGWQAHHKASLRIILKSPLLPLDQHQRLIIGSIARYHRRALPSLEHDHYAALGDAERKLVDWLAAILRLADGLDSTHQSLVMDVFCKTSRKKIIVHCLVHNRAGADQSGAQEKSDLLKKVSGRGVEVRSKKVD